MKASIPSRIKTILFRLAVFSLLVGITAPAYAQVSPRGGVEAEPPGRVLQAATCVETGQHSGGFGTSSPYQENSYNALELSVSPTTVKAGEKVTVTYSVKAECQSKLSNAAGFQIQLFHQNFNFEGTNRFSNIQNQGSSGKLEILASTNTFSVGAHQVSVALVSLMPKEVGLTSQTNYLTGTTNFTVQAASQTGNASLTNLFVSSGVDGSGIVYEYSFSYQAGSSGVNAAFVSVDCGGGTLSLTNPIPYGTGGNARCVFPKPADGQPKDYTITFQALDSNKQPITGASSTAKVTVTGKETNSTVGTDTSKTCISLTSGPICVINYVIAAIVQVFNSIVKFVLLRFLGPFIESLVSIRTYTDDFATVIYSAWQILRNLGNIFFILSIVAIGVATVFRISGYAVKDLLVKLIVGAILINFSLTIAQAILGIADTVTNQFLGPNTGAIRAIVNPLVTTDIWANVTANAGDFSSSIQGVFSFWLSFAAFIAFLGVAFLLFFRLIMLWILLMLSPLPYIAMVLPVTRKMSKTWWSKFMQWAFNAPIVAFMLNLTATITVANSNIIQKLANVQTGNSSQVTTFMFAVAGQAIPIAFMFMTVKAGASVGKGAAGFIDKAIDKGAKAAFIPAALTGAALGSAAVGAGKFAKGVTYDKAKEGLVRNVKLGQAKLAQKVAPKEGASGFSAFARRRALDVVTGGALSAEFKAKKDSGLKDAQALTTAYVKDARRMKKGEAPSEVKGYKDAEVAKATKEKNDAIKDNTAGENNQSIVDSLNSAASSFAKTVDANARVALALEKKSFDGEGTKGLKNKVAVEYLRSVGRTAEADSIEKGVDEFDASGAYVRTNYADANIEDFYQALAAKGMDKQSLERMRNTVNAKMIADGRYDNIINPDVEMVGDAPGAVKGSGKKEFSSVGATMTSPSGTTYTDTSDKQKNTKFQVGRAEKKSARDMASNMDAAMFKKTPFVARFAYKLGKLPSTGNAKSNAAAELSQEKIKNIRQALATDPAGIQAELENQVKASGVTGTAAIAAEVAAIMADLRAAGI